MNPRILLLIVLAVALVAGIVGLVQWRRAAKAKWIETWAAEATALGLSSREDLQMSGTYRGRKVSVRAQNVGGNTEGDPGTWLTIVEVYLQRSVQADSEAAKPLLKKLKRKAVGKPAWDGAGFTVRRKGKHSKPGQVKAVLDELSDVADELETLP